MAINGYRIKFCSVFTLLAALACSPENPRVNSPGAGNYWKFEKVSGDNQSTGVMDTLDERLVVKLTDLVGNGIENKQIHFHAISGDGQVLKPVPAGKVAELIIITDFEGLASAQFRNLGGDDVTGLSQVKAEVMDSTKFWVVFTIGTD